MTQNSTLTSSTSLPKHILTMNKTLKNDLLAITISSSFAQLDKSIQPLFLKKETFRIALLLLFL